MKKIVRISAIVLFALICIFAIFIIEENIRLSNNVNAHPLIVLKIDENINVNEWKNKEIIYYSLGFSLKERYYLDEKSSNDNYMYHLNGGEFLLFNKFRLWVWVF